MNVPSTSVQSPIVIPAVSPHRLETDERELLPKDNIIPPAEEAQPDEAIHDQDRSSSFAEHEEEDETEEKNVEEDALFDDSALNSEEIENVYLNVSPLTPLSLRYRNALAVVEQELGVVYSEAFEAQELLATIAIMQLKHDNSNTDIKDAKNILFYLVEEHDSNIDVSI